MFCVRCGREAELREGLCPDCFLARRTLARLPEVVKVEVCALCGARQHRTGSWGPPVAPLERAIEEELRGLLELDPVVDEFAVRFVGGAKDLTNYEYEAHVQGTAAGLAFEARVPALVHVHRSTCQRCGRRSGGYYESILQLRAEGRAIDVDERDRAGRIIERTLLGLRDAGDLDSFLTKAAEVRGGWDFYLGTVHAGRAVAKALAAELGALVKETASLVGRSKEGIDLYRVTLSVKLPRARIGGFVAMGERLYEVGGVGPKVATLVDLDAHRPTSVARADLDRVQVLPPGEAREAVVVSESGRELQVLDPESLRTVELVKPPGFPAGRRSVRVVRWAERLWLLPERADRLT